MRSRRSCSRLSNSEGAARVAAEPLYSRHRKPNQDRTTVACWSYCTRKTRTSALQLDCSGRLPDDDGDHSSRCRRRRRPRARVGPRVGGATVYDIIMLCLVFVTTAPHSVRWHVMRNTLKAGRKSMIYKYIYIFFTRLGKSN